MIDHGSAYHDQVVYADIIHAAVADVDATYGAYAIAESNRCNDTNDNKYQ